MSIRNGSAIVKVLQIELNRSKGRKRLKVVRKAINVYREFISYKLDLFNSYKHFKLLNKIITD